VTDAFFIVRDPSGSFGITNEAENKNGNGPEGPFVRNKVVLVSRTSEARKKEKTLRKGTRKP
jgi:hypothetical protein